MNASSDVLSDYRNLDRYEKEGQDNERILKARFVNFKVYNHFK